jgi:hypothetical protein
MCRCSDQVMRGEAKTRPDLGGQVMIDGALEQIGSQAALSGIRNQSLIDFMFVPSGAFNSSLLYWKGLQATRRQYLTSTGVSGASC